MSDRIVDDREDYRDWINDLIKRMSDKEKTEYQRKMERGKMDISNITESQKAKLKELEIEFRKRASEMPEKDTTKDSVLDNGYGRFTELWDWYKSEAQKIVANG